MPRRVAETRPEKSALSCLTKTPIGKNHEYVSHANSIVDALPPQEIPRVRISHA